MKKLLIIGGHGSGEIAATVFEDINKVSKKWDIIGFLSDVKKPGEYLGKYKIIDKTSNILDYTRKGYYIHNTLFFNAKDKSNRIKNFFNKEIPLELNATGIHPLAYINPSSNIGYGCLFLPFSATQFGVEVEDFVHVYTSAFIGHDSSVKRFSTVAAHSIIGGRVTVGEGCHIGLNSSIREDVNIGKYSIIGMASNVLNSFDDYSIIVGNPAKLLRKNNL